MALILPHSLPAIDTLRARGFDILPRLERQRPYGARPKSAQRPLRVAVLNLMPEKAETEETIAAALADTDPAQRFDIDFTLVRPTHYRPQSGLTCQYHLTNFYATIEEVMASGDKFDLLIVTGSPVELKAFEDVSYWEELTRFFDWAKTNVFLTHGICWGAQALLKHHRGIEKHVAQDAAGRPQKLFGIYNQSVHTCGIIPQEEQVTMGLGAVVYYTDPPPLKQPVSRYTITLPTDCTDHDGLVVEASHPATGVGVYHDTKNRVSGCLNHPEYPLQRLAHEYQRDVAKHGSFPLPVGYYPDDNPSAAPQSDWQKDSRRFFNDLLTFVTRHTPYDLTRLNTSTPLFGTVFNTRSYANHQALYWQARAGLAKILRYG